MYRNRLLVIFPTLNNTNKVKNSSEFCCCCKQHTILLSIASYCNLHKASVEAQKRANWHFATLEIKRKNVSTCCENLQSSDSKQLMMKFNNTYSKAYLVQSILIQLIFFSIPAWKWHLPPFMHSTFCTHKHTTWFLSCTQHLYPYI